MARCELCDQELIYLHQVASVVLSHVVCIECENKNERCCIATFPCGTKGLFLGPGAYDHASTDCLICEEARK